MTPGSIAASTPPVDLGDITTGAWDDDPDDPVACEPLRVINVNTREQTPVPEDYAILVVDDEPALCRMLSLMLKSDGHSVVAAANADEAIASLESHRFDLVLSDHGLGAGMSGLELAGVVRQRWPGTRFILATGWGTTLDENELRPRGVETVLSKPYGLAAVRAVIQGAQT